MEILRQLLPPKGFFFFLFAEQCQTPHQRKFEAKFSLERMLLLILAIAGASILDIDYFSPGPNQRSWRRQRRMDADIDGAGSDGLLFVSKAYCCLTFNLLLLSVTYWLMGRPCRGIRVFRKHGLISPGLPPQAKNQTEATALLSRTEEESVKSLIFPHLARNLQQPATGSASASKPYFGST